MLLPRFLVVFAQYATSEPERSVQKAGERTAQAAAVAG
jgi:hypothetical protein